MTQQVGPATANADATETMESLDDLRTLLVDQQPPCLSVYVPTHRGHPDNGEDLIRFKNHLTVLEDSLLQEYAATDATALLAPFRKLAEDAEFWAHTQEGLAVLGNPRLFRTIKLPYSVPDFAVVANSFHIKPLLRSLQLSDRYQVMSLNRRQARLFQGSRTTLQEIALPDDMPRTITEALGDQLTEPHQTSAGHGGAQKGGSMRNTQGSKKDEVEVDEVRYFRAVDRAVMERFSRPSGLPLILAALTEYHTPFRRLTHNSQLMEQGIETDANALSLDQLRERAWAIVEAELKARITKLCEVFQEDRAKNMGSDDLAEVAFAATQSRVKCLLLEDEREIPGRLDPATGSIQLDSLDNPQVDDLLDDLAELVILRGGRVVLLPAADMPSSTGLAASFRF